MGVRVRGKIILLAALLVECLCLQVPKNSLEGEPKRPGCGEEQCSVNVSKAKLASSSTAPDVETPKPTQPGYADVSDDDDEGTPRPILPALPRQPTKEEMEAHHKVLEQKLYADAHPDEPANHVLERWGFFDSPTFGALDRKRDEEYAEGISSFEEMIKDDKKLTKRQKKEINAELEKFLEDDHKYQVWSAHVYKQEKHKRKKRGIPEHEIYSYDDMPNPYYQKKK